jgi:hypothetical protein
MDDYLSIDGVEKNRAEIHALGPYMSSCFVEMESDRNDEVSSFIGHILWTYQALLRADIIQTFCIISISPLLSRFVSHKWTA